MPNYQQQQNREPQSSREGAASTSNQDAEKRTESTQTPTSTQGSRGAGTSAQGASGASNESREGKSEENGTFAERAGRAVEQYKSTAIERFGSAREQAESTLDAQRHHVTDRIQRVGDLLRGASEQLRHEDETIARYMDVASVRVERVAQYINNADLSTLADDVNRFARERPAWVIGGSFLAGLAIARFLKSTAPSERQGSQDFAYSKTGSRSYSGQDREGQVSSAYGPTARTERSSYGQSPGYTTQASGYEKPGSTSQSASPQSTSTPNRSYAQSSSYPQSYMSSPKPQEAQSTQKSPASTTASPSSTPSTTSTTSSTAASTGTSAQPITPNTTQKVGFPQGQNPNTRKGES